MNIGLIIFGEPIKGDTKLIKIASTTDFDLGLREFDEVTHKLGFAIARSPFPRFGGTLCE